MAWTSPRTWVAGEVVTAALINTHLRDNLNHLNDSSSLIIARTKLTAVSDMIRLPAAGSLPGKKWLKLVIFALNSGVINCKVRLNASAAGYYWRYSDNGGADGTGVNTADFDFDFGGGGSRPTYGVMEIVSLVGQHAAVFGHVTVLEVAGTVPNRKEMSGKWQNTAAITSIEVINSGTGDFAVGSEAILYGLA